MTKVLPLAAVLLFAAPLAAQVPGYPNGCAACGIEHYIDTPRELATTMTISNGLPVTFNWPVPVISGDWAIGGWGFECQSGAAVDRVEAFYSDDSGFYQPLPWWLTRLTFGVERPDVAAAYRAKCPAVSSSTGFDLHIYPGALPIGTHVLLVNVWRGPYRQQSTRVVVVQ